MIHLLRNITGAFVSSDLQVVWPSDEIYVAGKFPVSEQITKEAEAFIKDLLRMEKEEV